MTRYRMTMNVPRLMLALLALSTWCTTAVADPSDIIVGAPNALTGGYGEASQHVVEGLQVAVDELNERGGIKSLGGAKLRLIPADTSDKPDQAASVTRRLITQDHAVILVGANTSAMTLSAQIEAEKARIPLLTTSYADAIVQRGMKYTFKLPTRNAVTSAFSVKYAAQLVEDASGKRPTRIAVYNGSDAASQASYPGTLAQAAVNNLTIVSHVAFQSGLTDPTPVVSATLQTRPDLIFLSSITPDTILCMRALRAVGVTVPVVSGGGAISSNSTGAALGTAANGLMGVVTFNWDLPLPGVKELIERYHRRYPNQPYPPASDTVGQGYAIGLIIGQALEKAATTDPTKIREVLASTEFHVPLPGGKVAFDATGLNRYGEPIMVEWVKGQLRTVWPKQYQTVKPSF
jgi:branched-chain amino acid transport system substrate-binding protein